jgi:hypothetical protein
VATGRLTGWWKRVGLQRLDRLFEVGQPLLQRAGVVLQLGDG